MDRATIEPAIRIVLTEIHFQTERSCAHRKSRRGGVAEGVTVSMDIEQLIYEAGHLQDATSLLNRLSRE